MIQAKAALDYLQGGGGGDPDPEPDPEVVAKVGTLSLTKSTKGKNTSATASVRIVDAGGASLGSATVTGCFSGAIDRCSSATTSSSGQATFSTPKYKGTGAVTFCVTNVTGPNDSFDATNACRTN